jgi:hypothetical protein
MATPGESVKPLFFNAIKSQNRDVVIRLAISCWNKMISSRTGMDYFLVFGAK